MSLRFLFAPVTALGWIPLFFWIVPLVITAIGLWSNAEFFANKVSSGWHVRAWAVVVSLWQQPTIQAVLVVGGVVWVLVMSYHAQRVAIRHRAHVLAPELNQIISEGDALERDIRGDTDAESKRALYEYRDEQFRKHAGAFLGKNLPKIGAERFGLSKDGDTVGVGIIYLYSRLKRTIDNLVDILRHMEEYVERSGEY